MVPPCPSKLSGVSVSQVCPRFVYVASQINASYEWHDHALTQRSVGLPADRVPRDRPCALRDREMERFVQARPVGAKAYERAKSRMPNGVPMSWMSQLYTYPPIFLEPAMEGRRQVGAVAGDIACMVAEAVITNTGVIPPRDGVHTGLRRLTSDAEPCS